MGSWTAILVAYLVGGITFVPLVIAAVLAHAYYTFPRRDDVAPRRASDDEDDIVQPGDDTAPLEAANKAAAGEPKAAAAEPKARANPDLDVAAGYFAVCREYTPMGINAKPIERPTPVGSATVASPSPSVYQTMYRSIFDRKPVPGPLETHGWSQRPKKAGNVFYVVLRHGHLMLFDDDEQLEVRHVISLAHHDISIYSGGDITPEGELFIKRNALCLSRRRDRADQAPDSQLTKPFYLFSDNCSAKEDFYFALLRNQEQTFGFDSSAPRPKQFDVKNIISLVQKLHSSEDHIHSRWLNAMLGRVFLAIYKTPDLENFIRDKITNKISRVKRPSFLTNITIQGIDTGEAAPYFTSLKLKDLTVEGECVVEADVRYTGNFRIQVGATAKIDLGARFKSREVNLVLAVVLKRVEGHVLFKIKAPPSNRVWLSFQTMPKLEMAIEPIVSSRQITYTVILRQIEHRIKEVVAETLVQPFWDDVPFFRTEHKSWRGGIFQGDDEVESPETAESPADQGGDGASADHMEENRDLLNETRPLEKSHSFSIGDSQPEKTGLFGRKLGKNGDSSSTSVVSTGLDTKASNSSPLRSPRIIKNSTDPIVGTETAHADLFKPSSSPPDHATNYMAALQLRSQDSSPMTISAGSPGKARPLAKASSQLSTGSKEDGDGDKKDEPDVHSVPPGRRNTASSAGSSSHGEASNADSPAMSTTGSLKNQPGSLSRNFFLRRENSNATISTVSSNGETKRNPLAAVTNAAVQAKQWGWNAIQRQKDARRNGERSAQVDLSQPMGRGQPLPPPGVPLPGPSNGRTKIGPIAAPKRKPVPEHAPADAHAADLELEPRSAPPASSAQRQRRRPGEQQSKDEEQNMLVVAAPDDSPPGTPAAEDKVDYGAHWADGAAAVDRAPETASGAADTVSATPRSPSSTRASSLPVREMALDSPIVALPAAAASGDDDDDYSGWIEDDILGEEQLGEAMTAAVSGEIKQGSAK